MTKLEELWVEAYKLSHALAELTEQQHDGKEVRLQWMEEFSQKLNCTVRSIASRSRGERSESVSHE
jgi:hypothetical protein